MGQHRQQVLEAARALVIEKGLFEFSMRDLAKAAGLSVGSLYREVRNKDDLLLLAAAENIRRHGLGLNQSKALGLNSAEQVMFQIGFAPYCIDFVSFDLNNDDMGTGFLLDNCGLVGQASAEIVAELKDHFQLYRLQVDGLIDSLIEQQALANDKARAMEVVADLSIVCRGTRVLRVMRTNIMFRPNLVATEKLCQLGELVLGQLDWHIDGPLLNPKKLELAWKTAMDQNFNMPIATKKPQPDPPG
ncbi:DNA-binding transcriptional regulator, AcrR family [Ferrimonas sediminum]|uniref:DNA-binding transcriptional regulator, AcrR family n=1 Tax=Ferrimonas sediminum TaxID=718193 RepID=A0A1G8JXX1_9GAMM|nr:TetR/AcrR family transcriptional regulator [Ferrimonas sediminum]SDI35460.1 DNA-binding transcriptional regulator, AcrR family [Ferrimonas sediminum]